MGKLTVTYDGVAVTPNRPEDPDKNYGSSDVPSGTNAVVACAARCLTINEGKDCGTVNLDNDTQDSKLTTLKAGISVVGAYTSANEEAKYIMERSEVLEPTLAEKNARIDTERGFTDAEAQDACDMYNHPKEGEAAPDPQRTLDEQKALLRKKDLDGEVIVDIDTSAAKTLITDELIADIVERKLDTIKQYNLETALDPTVVCSGNATINSNLTTLTDGSATFQTDSLVTTDIIKISGHLCKVGSVTSETVLELATPAKEINPAEAYKVLRDDFMSQFEFATSE